MTFPENFINKIICGDNLQVMKNIPDQSIDVIVTSPPYNLHIRKTFNNTQNWKGKWNNSKLQSTGYDQYNDYMPEPKYIAWQRQILQECLRLLKDDGCMFYNHKWRVQNGLYQQRNEIMDGMPLRQIIIWQKSGGINFNEGYFLPTYEVIYLLAKPKFKLAKGANRHGDVWKILPEKNSWHPAPFPLDLATRCISSTNGKLVLDPFVGSGTVPVACKQLGKDYIGIDISEQYCEKVRLRLS